MTHENIIKVVNNFLSEEEMKFFRDYEDYVLENMQDKMVVFNNGKRPLLQFGKDFYPEYNSHESLDIISDIEDKVRDIFSRLTSTAKIVFDDSNDLYVCSFWIAKQLPGANVAEHEDTDGGSNYQFKYNAVIYLNTLQDGGELIFTQLGYSHKPVAGDLIIFKSVEAGMHMVNTITETRYTLPFAITEDKSFAI